MGIVGLDSLASDIVEKYEKGIDSISAQAMDKANDCAAECLENIRNSSPGTGKYKKGWKKRKTKDGYIVYNSSKPNIEMPLEHGHIITRGPKKGQRTKAYPHIYKNADEAREKFIRECSKISAK